MPPLHLHIRRSPRHMYEAAYYTPPRRQIIRFSVSAQAVITAPLLECLPFPPPLLTTSRKGPEGDIIITQMIHVMKIETQAVPLDLLQAVLVALDEYICPHTSTRDHRSVFNNQLSFFLKYNQPIGSRPFNFNRLDTNSQCLKSGACRQCRTSTWKCMRADCNISYALFRRHHEGRSDEIMMAVLNDLGRMKDASSRSWLAQMCGGREIQENAAAMGGQEFLGLCKSMLEIPITMFWRSERANEWTLDTLLEDAKWYRHRSQP